MSFLYIILIAVLIYFAVKWAGKNSQKRTTQQNSYDKNTGSDYPSNATQASRPKYGKWVGGGLGWAFGGPIGGILGFAFGSLYDGMQSGKASFQGTRAGDFSVSLLVLTAAVMKADGKVLKSELDYVKAFLIRQFGEQDAQDKLQLLRGILKQDINLPEVCQQISQFMEYPSRLQLLHILFGISSADGHFHDKEVDMIEMISNYMGIRPADFKSIKAMFIKDLDNAYSILEISPEASNEEIKKAYHKMAIKYHPDKVAHLGEEIRNAAEDKFQELNAAYQEIKRQRGIE